MPHHPPRRTGYQSGPVASATRAALAGAILVALVGCSGATVPTPVSPPAARGGAAATVQPAPATPSAPSAAPPSPAAATDAPSPSRAGPEALTPDAALEARIPTLVRGIEIDVMSLSGAEFIERAPESELGGMIEAAGIRPTDVSVAIGVGQDEVGEIAVAAFRFPGAAQTALQSVFVAQLEKDSGAALRAETVGSYDVLAVDTARFVPTYLHVTNDVAIVVQANDPALAISAVEALPPS